VKNRLRRITTASFSRKRCPNTAPRWPFAADLRRCGPVRRPAEPAEMCPTRAERPITPSVTSASSVTSSPPRNSSRGRAQAPLTRGCSPSRRHPPVLLRSPAALQPVSVALSVAWRIHCLESQHQKDAHSENADSERPVVVEVGAHVGRKGSPQRRRPTEIASKAQAVGDWNQHRDESCSHQGDPPGEADVSLPRHGATVSQAGQVVNRRAG